MKEKEIRPKKIFEEYLTLAKKDARNIFKKSITKKTSCIACGFKSKSLFTKHSFNYHECTKCKTIFVNPRPLDRYFRKFYNEGKSVKFWSEVFYKKTAKNRKEKLWKNKAKKLLKLVNSKTTEIIDIGGGYGIFAEVIRNLSDNPITIIEPNNQLATVCRKKKFNVIEKYIEDITKNDLSKNNKLFVSFELFEHLHDPNIFLKQMFSLMKTSDKFCFTTLSGQGFDIQMLKENSNSIFPPHHLNFFNPISIEILAKKIGFKKIYVETPGLLDVDIALNQIDDCKDEFFKDFLLGLNNDAKKIFQDLLIETKKSSHMWVYLQK